MKKTVTIQYVNPPKPGKTAWTVKDTDGNMYVVGKKISNPGMFPKGVVEVECERPEGWSMDIIASYKQAPGASGVGGGGTGPFSDNVAGMTRVVADAIRAGLITEPGGMKIWALAYKEVVAAFNAPKLPDMPPVPDMSMERTPTDPPPWV